MTSETRLTVKKLRERSCYDTAGAAQVMSEGHGTEGGSVRSIYRTEKYTEQPCVCCPRLPLQGNEQKFLFFSGRGPPVSSNQPCHQAPLRCALQSNLF